MCASVTVFLCVCVFTRVVFVQQSALTVEPGRSFVNHTLLSIGVFNCGVIVGDKVRLQETKKKLSVSGVCTLCHVETQAVSQLYTNCAQNSLYTARNQHAVIY